MLLLVAGLFPVAGTAQDERVTVRVDGRSIFRVGSAGEQAAAERAERIERRLATLLENPEAIAPSRIERSGADGSERTISVAGVPVVTVTQLDAEDNLTTVDALASQWQAALDGGLERARGRRLSAWGRFTAEVQASVETAFRQLAESAIRIIPRALAALLVVGLFWIIATATRGLMRLIFHRIVADLTIENLIKQVAYYAVWSLGIVVAIDALGFNPQTVATGLGLTGLALGFALRDILSNFVSGVLILLLRPFEIGDQIIVGDTEGSVERIELRATQIRTYDGRIILVPNAELFTSRVTNNTAAPVRRGNVLLHLSYDTDLHVATEAIRTAVQSSDGVLETPSASVRIRELGPADITLDARYWADSRRSDFVATASTVRRAIVTALGEVGAGLPEANLRVILSGPEPNADDAEDRRQPGAPLT
ncbi:MAG: mechanosensitive ion channel family protein [Chloroflexota bacterium]|nr:mechanosensitive ion channel family protein [Chloroflexota bacterium]